ncbi:S-layer protein, partial [Deinococcus sp.]|uniref:S-layer protein n=1 Tax=Deinococcus sp. TaxID=47478 RepID=UPI0025BE6C41
LNAVQELAAVLAALGVRVSDLEENAVSKDDFSRLEARVEQLSTAGGDAETLTKLQGQIDDLTARAGDYDTLRAEVDDNASSIAALNDLTVLLNQDILDLQDRVGAVEVAQTNFVQRSDFDNLAGKVSGIDTRVTTLEKAPKFSVTGSLEPKYGSLTLNGDSKAGNFDVDRLTNNTFISGYFSNNDYCPKLIPTGFGTTVAKRGNGGVRCVDTSNTYNGFGSTVTVGVTGAKVANGAITINSASAGFTVHNGKTVADATPATETYVALSQAAVNGSLEGGVKFSMRFDNGNDSNSNFKFNDYLFANDNDVDNAVYRRGVVATVDASSISPLGPKVTVVSGGAYPKTFSKSGVTNTYLPGGTGPLTPMLGGYFGVRASVNPYNLGTVGVSYAQGNVASPLPRRDAASIDADLKFGPATLKGAYVASYQTQIVPNSNLDNADKAGYVQFGVDYMGLKVNANYRYIDPAFEAGYAGMSSNNAGFYNGMGNSPSNPPFGPNENGYGADASYGFGPVKLGAYVNSFKAITPVPATKSSYVADERQTAYGVNVGGTLARGLSAGVFFNDAQIGDQRVTELLGNNTPPNGYDTFNSYKPFKYSNGSNFGVNLRHDPKATDALVKGLEIDATYAMIYDDNNAVKAYKYNDFQAYAKYDAQFGVLKLTPFARFHYFNNPNEGIAINRAGTAYTYQDGSQGLYQGNATTGGLAHESYNYTTFKAGLQASTDAMDIVTKPSLFGGVSYRSTNFSDYTPTTATGKNSSELLANVGVTLNEFLFPSNKLSIGYSYYKGQNLRDDGYMTDPMVSNANSMDTAKYYSPYDATTDRIFHTPYNGGAFWATGPGKVNEQLDGVYGQWEGWGLRAAYGVFNYTNNNTGAKSTAQAFKVSTKIVF